MSDSGEHITSAASGQWFLKCSHADSEARVKQCCKIYQDNTGGDARHERLTVVLAPSAKKLAALVAYASQSFASPADADMLLVVDFWTVRLAVEDWSSEMS